jgi:tetratricopeptide (TPR) repeat protein
MRAVLQDLGFETQVLLNASREEMERGVEEFTGRIQPGDTALFYYSGHGVQADGANYLIPVDFSGSDGIAIRNRSFKLSEALERLTASGAAFKFVFLDACRDSGFPDSARIRSTTGTAELDPNSRGFYIAFSTSSGEMALDTIEGKNGRQLMTNGLFTGILSLELKAAKSADTIYNVMERVTRQMAGQVPWVHQNLTADWHPRLSGMDCSQRTGGGALVNMEAGNKAVLGNELGEAEKQFSDAIKLDSCDATAYLSRGLVYGLRNKSAEELQDLTQAIQLKNDDPVAYFTRALAYRRQGDCANAIKDLDQAIRLRPDLAIAYRYRGDCREKVRDYGAAEKDLTEAIRLDSKDLIARELLATVRLRNGEVKQAADDFTAVTNLKNVAPRAWRGLAEAQDEMGENQAAEVSRSRSLEVTTVPGKK